MTYRDTTKMMVALFCLATFALGMLAGSWTTQLSKDDLTPGRARGCEDSAVIRAIALNLIAAEDFDEELRDHLGELPTACDDPAVQKLVDPVILDWLERSASGG